METPQRQNNFVRSREAPMDFQYDEGNPFYVTTSIFGNTPIPTIPQQTESDVDDTAGIAGQKRTLFSLLVRFTGYTAWWHRPFSLFHSPPSRSLKPPGTLSSTSNSAPSTPFSNLVLFSTSFSPSSPFGATIVNKNNGNNNVTTKVDSTPKTPVMGGKFLFSPPNSDIFNSPSTSTLAGRAGAREFRQLKKRRAETAWTQRSRSRSSSRSRSRSRTRSTMDGRLSRIGGRDFGESDVSDSEGRSNNTRYKDANTSMYEDTGTDPQDYYSSPLPPTSQQSMMNRDMPYILSGYTQLLCNILLLGVGFYYVLQFVLTVQRDVDLKVEEYSSGRYRRNC
ncbi:hypothetical protein BC937DRAFT_89435 [Endogone sp. FLAS-F59071]|nr:hypothetical protein BC937DRAFT_89435 [Endogone sp. FLAS-F59071]|eukprot:RUS17832.1 hypothetical protein BC937DRAFT_89435 [Endogone sp. FLAS-F59071]